MGMEMGIAVSFQPWGRSPPWGTSSANVSLPFQHFFEGVKARVAQGVKEEEVSFQLAYSKQELRRVIDKYPGKEVKRALETLYKKIHKYLSPEENLLPVTGVGSGCNAMMFCRIQVCKAPVAVTG